MEHQKILKPCIDPNFHCLHMLKMMNYLKWHKWIKSNLKLMNSLYKFNEEEQLCNEHNYL